MAKPTPDTARSFLSWGTPLRGDQTDARGAVVVARKSLATVKRGGSPLLKGCVVNLVGKKGRQHY